MRPSSVVKHLAVTLSTSSCSRQLRWSTNYLAFIKLASIRIWLRAYESTPKLGSIAPNAEAFAPNLRPSQESLILSGMAEPEFVDFDPKFDMQQMSEWMLNAADYAEIVLKKHPKMMALCKELRHGAASIAMLHGQFLGGFNALQPVAAIITAARERREGLRQHYATSRAYFIEKLCEHYAEATIYYRQVQHGPGRPKAAMPNFEAFQKTKDHKKQMKMLQYSYEFAIAIELVKRKRETGRFSGLNKLLSEYIEKGLLDDVGDTEQRIKRLARSIDRDSPIYLTPGLREARATAQQFIYSLE